MVAFTLFYEFVSRRSEIAQASSAAQVESPQEFGAGAVGLAVFVCVIVVGLAAPTAYRSVDTVAASPALLVMNRFLLFIPSATLLILLNETVRSGRKLQFSRICVLLLLLLLVVITENPYTEKRNALGPVYLAMAMVTFQRLFASSTRRMVLLVCSMVLVFPATVLFTHDHQHTLGNVSLTQISDEIADHYFSINYDSWANIYTAVEIVKVHGVQWGHQLLGSLLFFVPSSLWSSKPLATGIFLGDYLMSNYSMWFTNLSAPLIAEGYLDFGPLGVIVYAGAAAFLVSYFNRLTLRRDNWVAFPLAIYASVFLMIVLRGSLMIAMGFASAAYLAFQFASVLLSAKFGVRRRIAGRMGRQPMMVR
jgi:hypothetical protein